MSEDNVSFLFLLLLPHHLACTFFTHASRCMGQWTHNKKFVLPLVHFLHSRILLYGRWTHNKEFFLPLVHFPTRTQVSTLTLHLFTLQTNSVVLCRRLSPLRVWVQIAFRDTVCMWCRVDFSGYSSFLSYHPLSSFIVPNRWRWMHFSTKPTKAQNDQVPLRSVRFLAFLYYLLFLSFLLSLYKSEDIVLSY